MITIIPWESYAESYWYQSPDFKLHIKKGTPEHIAKRLEADVSAYIDLFNKKREENTLTSDYLTITGIVYD